MVIYVCVGGRSSIGRGHFIIRFYFLVARSSDTYRSSATFRLCALFILCTTDFSYGSNNNRTIYPSE